MFKILPLNSKEIIFGKILLIISNLLGGSLLLPKTKAFKFPKAVPSISVIVSGARSILVISKN